MAVPKTSDKSGVNSAISDVEEWTTVKHKRKSERFSKRKNNQSSSIRKLKGGVNSSAVASSLLIDDSASERDIHEMILKCTSALRSQKFYENFESALARENIEGVVAFGIGNFSVPYSPAMLQLSCALLLRDFLSADGVLDGEKKSKDVEFYFFDPMTTARECSTLLSKLNVTVIGENERGKRPITRPTLFFMPHCPMRLYSNVLWSNWSALWEGKVMIYGNSMNMYDDRCVDSAIRTDPSNAILKVVPYATEIELDGWREKNFVGDVLRNMEKAFNDCSLISFACKNEEIPTRPEEHFHNEGDTELI